MNRAHGVPQLVFVGVRDEKDGFVAVIYLSIGEAGLVGNDELNMIFAGDVGGGDDCELAPVDSTVKADGANETTGNGAANRRTVPHALALDVVYVDSAAQQFVCSFLAGSGSADDAGFCNRAHDREGGIRANG